MSRWDTRAREKKFETPRDPLPTNLYNNPPFAHLHYILLHGRLTKMLIAGIIKVHAAQPSTWFCDALEREKRAFQETFCDNSAKKYLAENEIELFIRIFVRLQLK